ncbi:MAG: hypothetical protein K6G05_09325 [Lachnospiraceae bacterium]|nr:hypothetical protein [Lachnospiraceae bacterium]
MANINSKREKSKQLNESFEAMKKASQKNSALKTSQKKIIKTESGTKESDDTKKEVKPKTKKKQSSVSVKPPKQTVNNSKEKTNHIIVVAEKGQETKSKFETLNTDKEGAEKKLTDDTKPNSALKNDSMTTESANVMKKQDKDTKVVITNELADDDINRESVVRTKPENKSEDAPKLEIEKIQKEETKQDNFEQANIESVDAQKISSTGIDSEKKPSNSVATEVSGKKELMTDGKKTIRVSSIDLGGKSEQFKKIIDVAVAFEEIEQMNAKLKKQNAELKDMLRKQKEESDLLEERNKALTIVTQQKEEEIQKINQELKNCDEIIAVLKADKVESDKEYKNALAASLKIYYQDYVELKSEKMDEEIGQAISVTFGEVIRILEKNGIHVK